MMSLKKINKNTSKTFHLSHDLRLSYIRTQNSEFYLT